MDFTRNMFENILKENVPDISNKDIWIWGTGNTAQLYQEGFIRLRDEGFCISGYCDNDHSKWDKEFYGKPVISPEHLRQLKNVCVLICSPQARVIREVGRQLEEYHMEWYPVDEVILKRHNEEVLNCYDLLHDEESKNIYANLVACRIKGESVPPSELCSGRQYFAMEQFMKYSPKEVFVDCGAYVGDTVEQYIWSRQGVFRKIIAFEPDGKNFEAMRRRTARLTDEWNIDEDAIILCPYGVGDREDGKVFQSYMANQGMGSKFVDSDDVEGERCRIVFLDEYITEQYSFLKADIESYEYKMLLGAQKGIQKNRPLLAVCIYHNAVDLYSIPLLVKKIVPQYHVAIRHHSRLLDETVMYAWVDDENVKGSR